MIKKYNVIVSSRLLAALEHRHMNEVRSGWNSALHYISDLMYYLFTSTSCRFPCSESRQQPVHVWHNDNMAQMMTTVKQAFRIGFFADCLEDNETVVLKVFFYRRGVKEAFETHWIKFGHSGDPIHRFIGAGWGSPE